MLTRKKSGSKFCKTARTPLHRDHLLTQSFGYFLEKPSPELVFLRRIQLSVYAFQFAHPLLREKKVTDLYLARLGFAVLWIYKARYEYYFHFRRMRLAKAVFF